MCVILEQTSLRSGIDWDEANLGKLGLKWT